MRSSRRPRANRSPLGGAAGFTLLETLVALAVLATVLASAFGVFSTGLRGLSRSDERLTLALFAESLLHRGGLDVARSGGEASGTTADGLLRWRLTSVPYELPPAEVEAAVAAALPLLPREDTADRFGDGEADGDGEEGEDSAFASSSSRSRGGGSRGGGSSSGGRSSFGLDEDRGGDRDGEDPLAREARSPTGATRPALRLWRVDVLVENARGGSFALSTLHADRAR